MTLKQELIQLRELLSDSECWTTGALALDRDRCAVPPTSARAVCWCLAGGSIKVLGIYEAPMADGLFAIFAQTPLGQALITKLKTEAVEDFWAVSNFNDGYVNDKAEHLTFEQLHARVLALLDELIAEQP